MCLMPSKNIKHSYKLETIEGERLIPVWKIVNLSSVSPVYTYEWEKGWNKSTRRHKKPNLNDDNMLSSQYEENDICKGFHFFLSKKTAEKNAIIWYYASNAYGIKESCKIIKMYVRKTDIVAYGRSDMTDEYSPSLVAMNAYWKGD